MFAARHGHPWTGEDWAAIRGASTAHWGACLAHRCRDLTPARAVAAWSLRSTHAGSVRCPGVGEFVATTAALGPVGLVSASPRRYVEAAVAAFGLALAAHQATDAHIVAKTLLALAGPST